MEVRTSRFGVVNIEDDRIITFPKGLLGFPDCKQFCLLEPGNDACFFWLQSVDDATLAFVVTDPSLFVPDYTVPMRPDQAEELGITKAEDAQIFCIVNKVGDQLTGNLQGPLVINTMNRTGEQFVLADRRWTTRHNLVKVGERVTRETEAKAMSA
ncbi:MAG: flagellar assembly protein FliW [Phycisphaeraceae bacterium]|nr:flagellar assembly protein FliW [Phycisphaerales bacterium]MCB9861456.1 flagellar assembly protein FliW [Phycisphaeraceae bacterium]